jgi:predicted translin family RNA/ssDNA-binding protein
MNQEFFICDCETLEHMLVINVSDEVYDEPMLFINVKLNQSKSLLKRIVAAVKYILGKKDVFGDFDEFIVKEKDVDRMMKALRMYKLMLVKDEVK